MLAKSVTAEVERDQPQTVEQRADAKPERGIAGQAVQQDDGRPLAPLGVREPFVSRRSRLLTSRGGRRDCTHAELPEGDSGALEQAVGSLGVARLVAP